MYCNNCGSNNPDISNHCTNCGGTLNKPNNQLIPQKPVNHNYTSSPYTQHNIYMPPKSTHGQGEAIGSLICGIVSMVLTCFLYFPVINLILAIVALILYCISRKKGYIGGLATAALIISIIATIISVLFTLTCIACISVSCYDACNSFGSGFGTDGNWYWDI